LIVLGLRRTRPIDEDLHNLCSGFAIVQQSGQHSDAIQDDTCSEVPPSTRTVTRRFRIGFREDGDGLNGIERWRTSAKENCLGGLGGRYRRRDRVTAVIMSVKRARTSGWRIPCLASRQATLTHSSSPLCAATCSAVHPLELHQSITNLSKDKKRVSIARPPGDGET
jgi:hypothetical protein